jgi:Na+-translocating ferredoxin:NAD+ oxidoreductase RnfD subunit
MLDFTSESPARKARRLHCNKSLILFNTLLILSLNYLLSLKGASSRLFRLFKGRTFLFTAFFAFASLQICGDLVGLKVNKGGTEKVKLMPTQE